MSRASHMRHPSLTLVPPPCVRARARTCCRVGAVCPWAGGPVSVQVPVPPDWRLCPGELGLGAPSGPRGLGCGPATSSGLQKTLTSPPLTFG